MGAVALTDSLRVAGADIRPVCCQLAGPRGGGGGGGHASHQQPACC